MHSCTEVPSEKGKEDQGCLDQLVQNYSFLYRVGDKETVSASLVFKLSQGPQDVAVKVMPLVRDAIQDVKIACMLNNIQETPVFVKTFGWIKCGTIPLEWLKGMDIKKDAPKSLSRAKMFLFQVMAFSSHAWSDRRIKLDVEEYRVMLFLLLHGLYIAQDKIGFRHNDIHSGQILFQTCKPGTTIDVSIGENHYRLVCGRFVPKLIDFGLATLGEKEEEESESGSESEEGGMFEREEGDDLSDDLRNLFYLFEERMRQDGLKPFPRNKKFTQLEDILLMDPIFTSIRKNGLSSEEKIKGRYFCDVCSSVATTQWEGKPLYFCDEACAYSWKEINI